MTISSPHEPSALEDDSLVPARMAWGAFAVLFAMQLLDYTDRDILAGLLKPLRAPVVDGGLGVPIELAGWLSTIYLVSLVLGAPIMGWAGDRWRRTWLLGLGVGLWSLATLGSGLAQNHGQLALSRSLLGIGQATYGVIAPTLLVDLFPRRMRTRVLSWFYLAIPLGSALGIVLGGSIAVHFGWRSAFLVVGAPGLLLALLALRLPDPPRGRTEGIEAPRLRAHERAGATREDYRDLLVNSSYTYSVLGTAFFSFAIAGLIFWMPVFLNARREIPLEQATLALGLITAVAAGLGILLGGWICDRLAPSHPRALFIVPGLAMLGALPFTLLGLLGERGPVLYAGLFVAEMLMFVSTAPCNAIIANVTPPKLRTTAFAVALVGVHLLGDLWSPPLVGQVAHYFGRVDSMDTPIGDFLRSIGAVPMASEGQPPVNLVAGLLIIVPAIALSGIVLLAGARHLPREMALMLARLRTTPRP